MTWVRLPAELPAWANMFSGCLKCGRLDCEHAYQDGFEDGDEMEVW